MQFTVAQVLEECAPFLGAHGTSCADSPENLAMLNSVRQLIYSRNKGFVGTMGWMTVSACASDRHCSCSPDGNGHKIILPIEVGNVIDAASSSGNVSFTSRSYLLMSRGQAQACCTNDISTRKVIIHESSHSGPLAINPSEKFGYFLVSDACEDNATISLSARSGRVGEIHRIALTGFEPVRSPSSVNEIVSVAKGVTKGNITVYEADCNDRPGREIGYWPASSVNPKLSEIMVSGTDSCSCILLYYRKRWMALTQPDELVDIESIEALQLGYAAKDRLIAKDTEGYVKNLRLMEEALEQVNFTFATPSPSEEVTFTYSNLVD